jgi:protein associated with RNAse G/E
VVEVREEGVLTLLPQGGVFHHEGKGRRVVLDHDAYVAFFPGAWYSGGPDVREGRVLEYYWNVQTPAVWTGAGFRQYDLELDVRCRPTTPARSLTGRSFWPSAPFTRRPGWPGPRRR